MAQNKKEQDLLKLLGRPAAAQAPATPPQQSTPEREPVSRSARKTAPKATTAPKKPPQSAQGIIRGRRIQFYLHDADEKLIRELAVWLAPHRKRINDSLVIKAVLRAAKTGPGLLAAYDDAVAIDGRSKIHKKSKTA